MDRSEASRRYDARPHWKRWGHGAATATGLLMDGLGFIYRAQIRAYGLHVTHRLFGNRGVYGAWYTRLHVTARSAVYGICRGPFNVFIDVTPWY